jgi:sporulation protein YlmC with PRC-barrel domain
MFTSLADDDVLVSCLIGEPVVNEAGDKIGDIDELIMDKQGHLSAALIEVGGFIGVEEKLVAIPFSSLSIGAVTAGKPRIVAEFSRPYLAEAPLFKPPEQSSLHQFKDTATALGARAAEKASQLGHRAADAASKVAEMATDKASEVGKKLADKGPDLIQKAAEKASEVGQKIADKTSELIQKAAEKATEVREKIAEKGSESTREAAAPDDDRGQSIAEVPGEVKTEPQASSRE